MRIKVNSSQFSIDLKQVVRISFGYTLLIIQLVTVYLWTTLAFLAGQELYVPAMILLGKLSVISFVSGLAALILLPVYPKGFAALFLIWTVIWIPSGFRKYQELLNYADLEDWHAIKDADSVYQNGNLASAENKYSFIAQKEKANFLPRQNYLRTVLLLAKVFEEEKKLSEAEHLYLSALDESEKIGSISPLPANTARISLAQSLAAFYFRQNRYSDSQRTFEKALLMHEEAKSGNLLEAECHANYAELLRAVGNMPKAQIEKNRADELRKASERAKVRQ